MQPMDFFSDCNCEISKVRGENYYFKCEISEARGENYNARKKRVLRLGLININDDAI